MQYYERKYELLQDALSNIGGISRLILSVCSIINYIFSRYITLIDSEELFLSQNDKNSKEEIINKNNIEKKIKKNVDSLNPPKKNLYYNNYQYKNNNILSNDCMSKENLVYSKLSKEDINIYKKRNNYERNENKGSNKYLIYNKNNYYSGKNYFYYERKEHNKIKENEKINPSNNIENNNLNNNINTYDKNKKENNENEFNFCKFLSHIICCCRKNKKINYIEELRYKILSEETILCSYLNLKEINKLSEFV